MLSDLLKGVDVLSVMGDGGVEVSRLGFDSRSVAAGELFFAIVGAASDGHRYIDSAIEAGAVAIVCQQLPDCVREDMTYVVVEDSNLTLGRVASNFYGNPSRKLKLVGITGTNGKTTTATLLYDMFRELGYKVGLISTVVYRIDDREIESTHTTPDAVRLNEMLSDMIDAGCDYCFMEVSSHSIAQNRIAGLDFAGGIFTNITHDHLDYHGTFAEYIRAKKLFFDGLSKSAFAIVNVDDRNGSVMVQNSKATVKTLSLQSMADFRCRIVETMFDGMQLVIDSRELWVGFLGRFNAYNLLGVYATAIMLGADKEEVLCVLSKLKPVNGRFEYLRSTGGVTAIVDYAHTPDALENVISTVNEIRTEGQRLFVVIGCGGNRDRTKRPKMAHIAASQGDLALLTSDNPRMERPEDILDEMKQGVEPGDRSLCISDRREAIRTAVMMATAGDIILVAGKGHETYQDINGTKHHFDDKEEIAAAFEQLKQ